jgi:4-hydroxy-3-polyprenylbenzoate decarboxylase
MRLIVGISGSTGAIYGIRLLQVLRNLPDVETHLVVSAPAKRTILEETDYTIKDVEALATRSYDNRDIGAAPASGSFKTIGMAIVPCSIRTAAALATSTGDTLLCRAGDVTLKEGRPLIVGVRETPLHVGHLRQLTTLAELGAVIFPPVPAFYDRPTTLDDIVNHTVGRILDRLRLPQDLVREWSGTQTPPPGSA